MQLRAGRLAVAGGALRAYGVWGREQRGGGTPPAGGGLSHSSGQWQTLTFSVAMPASMQTIGISFLNDAYGGSSPLDRNLFFDHIGVNGVSSNPPQGGVPNLWAGPAPTRPSGPYKHRPLSRNTTL